VSLFGSIAKIAGKVIGGKGLIGSVAKTLVGSVPILGGAISAVGAVKSAIRPPTLANTANLSSRTGVPGFGAPGIMSATHTAIPRALRSHRRTRSASHRAAPARPSPRRVRRAVGGVSAKQRAARARFARAAKRGRIRKGSRLR
jgi:hypothetical protein